MSNNTSSPTETLRLTPDTIQPSIVLVISLLLFFAGVELVRQGINEAWFLVVLFSLASAASLISILPGSCFLEIDHAGLKVVSRFRETIYRWNQIDRIGIFEVGIIKRIGIDLNATYPGPERVPKHMKSASGYHVTLPNVTGLEQEALLEILEKVLATQNEAL